MNKKKIISNFFWRFAERCGAQFVTFIVSIVLARILSPKDYGTIALVMVFTTILQVFVDSGLSQIINSWPNRKLLNYSYLEQVKDFAPGILLAVFMGICVYFIGYIPLPTIVTFVIQIISGAAIYIALSAILKLEEFEYLTGMIKSFLKR